MYDIILVGTDGSEKAGEAVTRAFGLAQDHDAELHAVTVVNTSRYGEPALSSNELVLNELEDRGNKQLKEINEQGSEMDIQVVTKCFHGNPTQEIIDYAQKNDVDLIVLGSYGHGRPRSGVGSTAKRVLRGTSREVLFT